MRSFGSASISSTVTSLSEYEPALSLRLLPNGLAAPASKRPTCMLQLAKALTALGEFITSALASYAASVAYHFLFIGDGLPSRYYIASAVVTAMLLLLISFGFRDFAAIQIQGQHAFLWRGLRSVALAFSLLLTGLFLLKLAELYSRAIFLFQFLSVSTAVLG